MNTLLLSEIEQRIAQLSPDERAFLITRLVRGENIYHLPDAETMRREITEMAQDPDIQQELNAMNNEFACTEMDGLRIGGVA